MQTREGFKIIMEVREGDRTTLIHRLAVLAIGLYSHTQITCPTKGICRNEPSDFASALTVIFVTNLFFSDLWKQEILKIIYLVMHNNTFCTF